MGKNHSKKKPQTEFSKRKSILTKLDNQLKKEEAARKKSKEKD